MRNGSKNIPIAECPNCGTENINLIYQYEEKSDSMANTIVYVTSCCGEPVTRKSY